MPRRKRKIIIFENQTQAYAAREKFPGCTLVRLVPREIANDGTSAIKLVAVDEDGDTYGAGNIIDIRQNGKFEFHSSISQSFGFALDAHGRVAKETREVYDPE